MAEPPRPLAGPPAEDVDVAGDAGDAAARVADLRDLSRLLDSAFRVPGTDFRVGVDPILGLLPVVGDAPAAALSAYIVVEAAALGAPRATVARMLLNLGVDAVVGSLPLVGDAFDAVWKANDRNVRLLDARLADPDATADRRVVYAATAALGVALLVLGALSAVALWWALGRAGVV
jgi:hypothetical protein